MRNIKSILLRSLAIAGFVAITLGSGLVRADTGVNNGYQSDSDVGGSATGGYTGSDSSVGPSSQPSSDYNNYNNYIYNEETGTYGSSSGAGAGGSTGSSGSEILKSDENFQRGRTENGVTYPDFSDELGPSGSGYFERGGAEGSR